MATKNKAVPTKGLYVAAVISDPQGGTSASNPTNRVSTTPAASRDGIVFPAASYAAATYTTDAFHTPDARGLRLFVDVTTNGGGTTTITVQFFDPASQKWVASTEGSTAALGADATTVFNLYPGIEEDANVSDSNPFSRLWRLSMVVATATMVFSVGAETLG